MKQQHISNVYSQIVTQRPQLDNLMRYLCLFGEARIVGGGVRNCLLGYPVKDVDIATTIVPSKIQDILERAAIQYIPTGVKFGTITALLNKHRFEITTLRNDIVCYGRHADVQFSTDWQEDAARRDFTINALYVDLKGDIYDYFHGIEDIYEKKVKFINNPEQRIHEDYLRILRYFRFLSFLGLETIDYPSLHAAVKLAKHLDVISGERIQNEMLKLLSYHYAKDTIQVMLEYGVMTHILLPNNIKIDNTSFLMDEPLVNLAALLKSNGCSREYLNRLAVRWRLSKASLNMIERLCCNIPLVGTALNELEYKKLYYMYGPILFQKALLVSSAISGEKDAAIYNEIIEKSRFWCKHRFPITGGDVMHFGYRGKQVGNILQRLQDRWIDSNFTLSKEQLMHILKNDII